MFLKSNQSQVRTNTLGSLLVHVCVPQLGREVRQVRLLLHDEAGMGGRADRTVRRKRGGGRCRLEYNSSNLSTS
jgi:hypothetical protein